MKSQFEYYEEIKRTFPRTMSKDQFYQVAHISKATALYLLQSGLVPCKDSGKKTRRYTIKTTDVIAYLQDRILYPAKYAAPDGWYIGRSNGKVRHQQAGVNRVLYFTPGQRTLLQDYFREEMSDLEDLITVKEFAEFLGYNPNSVVRWCNKLTLKCFKPPSKLTHAATAVPINSVSVAAHREIRQSEDDNVGVESAHKLEEAAEGSVRTIESAHHSHQLKPYRNADRAEAKADKANLKALNKTSEAQKPQFQSNPYSRWQQKRAIKKEYAAAKAGKMTGSTVKASEATAKAARKTAEKSKKTGEFIARHKKGFLIAIGIVAILAIFLNIMSSCSVMFQAGVTAVGATTYPCEDSDMLAAEAQYCAMEAELQQYLDTYESTHDYDEYHYDLDTIEHDPYVLISAITALHGGEWTIDEVGGILDMLFEKQYILTETVTSETRYRTETRTGYYASTDPETGEIELIPYDYDVDVPYTYYICTVKLENFNLSHVPVYIMSQDQLSMYAAYMGTLGNRPDLFAGSGYVDRYYNTEYADYEIPPEALEDGQFAAMIAEAEKYLGYPYVWGGSSPSTSFDCSGFVSWVINNCGVGWNVGRLGADSLRHICTAVSSSNDRPGDLIFFQGTYDTTGASHVGIYVGNGMMIHCGDPIQYASINTSYWQSHFLSFGRLPSP